MSYNYFSLYGLRESCNKNSYSKRNCVTEQGKSSAPLPSLLLVIALFLIGVSQSFAQSTANYNFITNSSGSLSLDLNANSFDMSTGTIQLVDADLDNASSSVTEIGFDFFLNGSKYSQFSASSNGVIQLGSSAVSASTYVVSSGSVASPKIGALAADLRTGSLGKVHYKVVGTAPNRCLVVEFLNMSITFVGSPGSNDGTYQVRLYETTGMLEFVYGSMYKNASNTTSTQINAGFSVGTAINTTASITTATNSVSNGATFNVNTYTNSTNIPNLHSTSDGNRRVYRFEPLYIGNPTTPVNFTTSLVTQLSTTVHWKDDSTNESFFTISRSTSPSGPFTLVGTVQSTTANTTGTDYSFNVTGLLPSTTYYYEVKAHNESGGASNPALTGNETTLSPGTIISIVTGNWNNPSTWSTGAVPTSFDSAIIDATHTVTIDVSSLAINNLTINSTGILAYGSTPTSFTVNGNLTVNTGGTFNVFQSTTGKTLIVTGNIVNNGTIDIGVGATTAGNLTLNGTTVQTVSGSGIFGTSNVIRNLTFSNTNTSIPNINWLINNVKVANNLSLTGARINLNGNKMTWGNGAAVGTLTAPNGSGFLPNAKFSRWWTTGQTGTTITAGADPTTATSRYPFITATGDNRSITIQRSSATTTGNTAGELAVVYTEIAGSTSGLSVLDGTYTVTNQLNDNWLVTAEAGYVYVSGTHSVHIYGERGYFPINGNSRVMKATEALGGAHQNGTITPGAQRTGVTTAELTAASGLHIGINAVDISITSTGNGNWNSPSTWSSGTVPTCNDVVNILPSHTINVNNPGNTVKNITIYSGGTLNVNNGDLTVGCTLNNNSLVNNGTLSVNSGATLNVNGNMLHNAGSTFNQSGGDIIVDGNNGITGESVATATNIVRITASAVSNLNLTGGTLTIVNPHKGISTTDYALNISQGGAVNAASTNHTIIFGNGTSTIDGGHSNGFYYYTFQGGFNYILGNIIVDTATGTNRFVKSNSTIGISGNLTINSGEYQWASTTYLSGNLVNNGSLVATVTLNLSGYNGTVIANNNSQSISGTGTFANSLTTVTANLTSLTVNNTSTDGITMNVPLSVSGTLTLTQGKINTSTANMLSLGTSTTAGTLSGGSATAYINGPFTRNIATSNANTNYILFPVGKTAYAPIWLAPATTAFSSVKAEAFDSNTGTIDGSIVALAANRRWEASFISGTYSNINLRLGDAGIVSTNIPVQAPSANGEYTSAFGSLATFAAGTPNTVQTLSPLNAADFTGFISYAKSGVCDAQPAPGNTITSAAAICLGQSVTLTLENTTVGTGVTYQWKSSIDGGSTFNDVVGAVNTTLTIAPSASTIYFCAVTCTGNGTTNSNPVLITFPNEIITTTPATICGTGSATLGATGNSGSTVRWYSTQTGGSPLATGTTFNTPIINESTNYYAAAETGTLGFATLGLGVTNSSTAGQSFFPGSWGGAKTQYIIRASELYAAGLTAGEIKSLGFEPTTSGQTYQGFYVNIGNTNTTVASNTAFISSGLTQVYAGTLADDGFTPTAGSVNTLAFGTGNGSSPSFVWDGTSNIVVSISWSRVPATTTATASTMKVDNVGFASTSYRQRDNNTPLQMLNETEPNTTTTNFRPRFTINGQLVCSSPRKLVIATVSTPPVLTLSGNSTAICNGETSAVVTITTGAADYDTYVWFPTTGVSGNAVTGWTFNPTTTTTYTLIASQSGGAMCNTSAAVTVTVNPVPTPISITTSSPNACLDTVLTMTANGGTIGTAASTTIGTATTLTGATSQPTAFCNRWKHYWIQIVYTAAELNAAGVQAGNINAIKFNITTLGDGTNVSDLNIRMGSTASSTLSSFQTTGLTLVKNYTTYNQAVGVNTLTFDTPYVWDGVSNIILDMRQTGADSINNSQTYFTATTGNTSITATTSTEFGSSDLFAASAPTGSTSVNRLNTTFDWSSSTPTNLTWTPTTDLYIDASATTAYLAGTNASTVYFKSNTVGGPVTYTATATSAANCTTTGTVNVTVNPNATIALTSGNTAQTVCANTAIGNIVYTLTNATGATTTGLPAGVTGAFNTGVYTLSGAPTVGGTFNYTVIPTGCGTATLSGTITVTETAAPTAPAAQSFCNSATVAELTATGTAIKWYTASTGGTALTANDNLSSATYYASQTLNGCESTRTAVSVTVNITTAPTANTQTFCNSATVADLIATGTAIQWYADAVGGTALVSTTALSTGTVYASQTINGCEGPRVAVSVTVNVTTAPSANAQTFCNSATVADLIATGTAIQWYANASGGSALISSTALTTGTYYVSQTLNGCESIRTSVSVTVNETAAPAGNATQSFTEGQTIADIAVTGSNIIWYASSADAAAGTNPLPNNTVLVNGTTYYATQTVNGCTSTNSLAVTATVTLSIRENDLVKLNYYPNPVVNKITITNTTDISKIEIISLLGQTVITTYPNATTAQIDMSQLPNATYMMHVVSEGKNKVVKIIKK